MKDKDEWEGGKEGEREGGKEGKRERGREGGREGKVLLLTHL